MKVPASDYTTRRPRHSLRNSMTQTEIGERSRLLAETQAQMARECKATEKGERTGMTGQLRQRQRMNKYWDPRGRDREWTRKGKKSMSLRSLTKGTKTIHIDLATKQAMTGKREASVLNSLQSKMRTLSRPRSPPCPPPMEFGQPQPQPLVSRKTGG
ncbi:hypothetical protein K469DRAFT_332767 [Zopfia rhizophila CBS 207.26]|uniref:Uncharacterized protein n=1 Tax=Zopfia rhizophila CBS 207.26 TaxID=1314779 RepID=A0A6A6DLE4_9PEZI|nr:hypothetical protein K469DRAFT_332767 [Zopfia rhizophila CBS 207.26]